MSVLRKHEGWLQRGFVTIDLIGFLFENTDGADAAFYQLAVEAIGKIRSPVLWCCQTRCK
ncbi:MAG: hypothetical protein H6672_19965 [Anaerolineaceae bacterium]|nr:hypothetical protein [Anaerolineaceae bacterium]